MRWGSSGVGLLLNTFEWEKTIDKFQMQPRYTVLTDARTSHHRKYCNIKPVT